MSYEWVNGKRKFLRRCDPKTGRMLSGYDPFWTEKRLRKIKELYVNKKWSMMRIAEYYKLYTHIPIYWILKKEGWVRSRQLNKNSASIKKWYLKDELTCNQISEKLKCDPSSVESHIKKRGYARSGKEMIKILAIRGVYKKIAKKSHIKAWNNRLKINVNDLTYEAYKKIVRGFTNLVAFRFKDLFLDQNKKRGYFDYHLDHQFSLMSGYWKFSHKKEKYVRRNRIIPLEIMCHPANLKLITADTNQRKCSNNHITLKNLKLNIINFDTKHGRVFANDKKY